MPSRRIISAAGSPPGAPSPAGIASLPSPGSRASPPRGGEGGRTRSFSRLAITLDGLIHKLLGINLNYEFSHRRNTDKTVEICRVGHCPPVSSRGVVGGAHPTRICHLE